MKSSSVAARTVNRNWLVYFIFCAVIFLSACGEEENEEAEGITLEMTAWGDTAELEVYQKAVDAFNEEHPNIHVNLTPTPSDTYQQRLMTQLQGGEAPDIFYAQPQMMSILVDTNTIEPLDDFMNSDESYAHPEEFADGLWGASRVNGQIFGAPVDNNPLLIYYNRGLLNELGIKTPQEYYEEDDWNWDSFREVSEELQANGHGGLVLQANWDQVASWVFSNGGELYNDEGEPVMDKDPKTQEAMEFIEDMINDDLITYGGGLTSGQGEDTLFVSEVNGMISGGRWFVPSLSQVEELDYDFIPYPTNTGNKMEPAGIGSAYMVANKDSEHKEEALKFLSYYVSESSQDVRLSGTGNAVPSVKGIDEVVTEADEPDHVEYLIDAREIGVVNSSQASVPGLDTEMMDFYELFMTGQMSAEEMLNESAESARLLRNEYVED
ncbi:ABC transporter substrate-binding protein [Alteribacillus sp. HJP-4]|uniref:ABC transporter substrate-binding protein n=1 Tax=Alteribacillus sp. HJP-4 TaxID=2775394 RepID=UPI0035CCD8F5